MNQNMVKKLQKLQKEMQEKSSQKYIEMILHFLPSQDCIR